MQRTLLALLRVAAGIVLGPALVTGQRSTAESDAERVRAVLSNQFVRFYNAADATGLANRPWPSLVVVLKNARFVGSRRAEIDGVLKYSHPAVSSAPTSDFTAVLVAEQGGWRIQSLKVSQLRGARID